jgi:hypothetical protein
MHFFNPNNIRFIDKKHRSDKVSLNIKNKINLKSKINKKSTPRIKDLTASRPFAKNIKLYSAGTKAYIEMTPQKKNDKGGCRAVGLALSALIHYFSIEKKSKLPKTAYIKSTSGFQSRALITLKYIGDPELRRGFVKSFSNTKGFNEIIIPNESKSGSKRYEKHAINYFNEKQLCSCQKGKGFKLKVPGLPKAIDTDGIDFNKEKNKLTILEIKDLETNFTEGITELIQNYGIVKEYYTFVNDNHSADKLCKNMPDTFLHTTPEVTTWLLCSKRPGLGRSKLYKTILTFMKSRHKISFFVAK